MQQVAEHWGVLRRQEAEFSLGKGLLLLLFQQRVHLVAQFVELA